MPFHTIPAEHSLFVQILNGHEVWRKCTPRQRELLRGARTEINSRKRNPAERYAVKPKIDAPPRTIESLQRKGIVDDRGILTLLGCYGVIFGPTLDDPGPRPIVDVHLPEPEVTA